MVRVNFLIEGGGEDTLALRKRVEEFMDDGCFRRCSEISSKRIRKWLKG